jgi:hypothetical protein
MGRIYSSEVSRHASRLMAVGAIIVACALPVRAAIISGAGSGDITFHSTFFPDLTILPSNTTGTVAIPQWGGALSHEATAPGGLVHSYMRMSWDYTPTTTDVFIVGPASPATLTRLELSPSPPVPVHHAATMTGSFEILYTLDAAGLPGVVLPAESYQVVSYVSPLAGSPAGASFDAHWDYTDVGFGLLGSQDIHYIAPTGLGVLATVSSLPLFIAVPAGHTTLKVSGFFKLAAASDDFLGGPPPFDTMIGIIHEPGGLSLLASGIVAAALTLLRRRHA